MLEGEVVKPPQGLCAACARAWRIPGLTNSAAAAPKPTTAWLILTDSSSQLPLVRICVLPAVLRSTGGRAMMAGAAKGTRSSPSAHPSVQTLLDHRPAQAMLPNSRAITTLEGICADQQRSHRHENSCVHDCGLFFCFLKILPWAWGGC